MPARTPQQPVRWIRIGAVGLVSLIAPLAGCTNLDDLTEPDCAYAVSPAQIDVDNEGGRGTLAIRTPGVCAWTVETEAGWVSLTGDRSGSGDGNLGYAIAEHEGFDYRYATIRAAGHAVTVSQAGRPLPPVCSYSVSPVAVSSPVAGGPGSIAVAAPAGCEWSATSQAAWMTTTAGANGSGSGAFAFLVAANGGTAARTGAMSAGGQTITVTQAGTGGSGPAPTCTFSVAPTSASFSDVGGTGSITVTTAAGCAWTAVAQHGWITIISGSSGSGSGTVRYAVAPHTGDKDRQSRITVGGRTVTITQEGDDHATR